MKATYGLANETGFRLRLTGEIEDLGRVVASWVVETSYPTRAAGTQVKIVTTISFR